MPSLPGAAARTESRSWAWVVFPFLATRALIVAVGGLTTSVVKPGPWWRSPWGEPKGVFDLFLRWDAEWFLRIVRDGYSFRPGEQSPVAFWPLYPMLVHAVATLGIPDSLAGVLISNVAFYVAAVLGYELWEREYGSESVARTAVLFLLAWPVTFFDATVYSDATFLALWMGVMLAARSGRWLVAGLLGACLSATRQVGMLVVVPLLLEAWGFGVDSERRALRKGAYWIALVPLGALLYMIFLWHAFADPVAFLHVGHWQRDMPGIRVTLERVTEREWLYRVLFVGTSFLLLGATIAMVVKRSRPSNAAWCAIVWYTSAASGTLEAVPRLTMVALPLFGFMAAETEKHPTTRALMLVGSAMLLAVCTTLFTNGYWMT